MSELSTIRSQHSRTRNIFFRVLFVVELLLLAAPVAIVFLQGMILATFTLIKALSFVDMLLVFETRDDSADALLEFARELMVSACFFAALFPILGVFQVGWYYLKKGDLRSHKMVASLFRIIYTGIIPIGILSVYILMIREAAQPFRTVWAWRLSTTGLPLVIPVVHLWLVYRYAHINGEGLRSDEGES
ncbi:hypothetical protein [Agrobacterium sp. NPDC089420]|uniref:hypothetical protein n=1 Tax=Agrobacterium sp. NPDC089420 TaxID=3363918 RepID=UPI0038515D4A